MREGILSGHANNQTEANAQGAWNFRFILHRLKMRVSVFNVFSLMVSFSQFAGLTREAMCGIAR